MKGFSEKFAEGPEKDYQFKLTRKGLTVTGNLTCNIYNSKLSLRNPILYLP